MSRVSVTRSLCSLVSLREGPDRQEGTRPEWGETNRRTAYRSFIHFVRRSSLYASLRSPCLVVLGSLVLLAYGSRNGVECGECKESEGRGETEGTDERRK